MSLYSYNIASLFSTIIELKSSYNFRSDLCSYSSGNAWNVGELFKGKAGMADPDVVLQTV